MAIKAGLPNLKPEWDASVASIVANRFRDIDDFSSNIQRPPLINVWFSGDPGETLSLSPSGATVVVTGAGEDLRYGMTYGGSGTGVVTIRTPALYYISYSMAFRSGTANRHVETSIVHNSTWHNYGATHVDFSSANSSFSLASCCILDLDIGDTISLGARCVGNTTTITIEHLAFCMFRVYF